MMRPIFFQKNYWKLLVLPFILFFLQSYAQKKDSLVSGSPNIIFLQGETLIYSADESFNLQINEGKIIVKNSSTKYDENAGKQILIISNSVAHPSTNRDSDSHLKQLDKQVNHNNLAETRKIIAKYKEELKNYIPRNFESHHSEESFSTLNHKAQYYLLPGVNLKKKIKKFDLNSFSFHHLFYFLIFLILFAYFNKQAFISCYSKAFKIRPPPVFS